MSTEKKYRFIGGPLNGQAHTATTQGHTPTALDAQGNTIRVDRADQAIGRMARSGKPAALYLRVADSITDTAYAWLVSASLLTVTEEVPR